MGDGSGETPEEELLDLLTCHRSDSQMHDWYIVLILCFIYSTYMLDLQHKPRSTKASEGPYAWESALEINSAFRASTKRTQNGDIKCAAACPSVRPCSRSLDKVSTWWALFSSSLASTPGLKDMLEEARSIGCIDFKLPPLHSTSGIVLKRAVGSMETLFAKHYPMIFKVGFCHDPVFRWCNSLYGYHTAKEKWTTLCVLYVSDEPYSVSMLEAASIEKYGSILTIYMIYIACTLHFPMYFLDVRTCLAYTNDIKATAMPR